MKQEWIAFRQRQRSRGTFPLNHLVIASIDGRFATACGRGFDIGEAAAVDSRPRNCKACARRLVRSQYLIPAGPDLEKLLVSPQYRLFAPEDLFRRLTLRPRKARRATA